MTNFEWDVHRSSTRISDFQKYGIYQKWRIKYITPKSLYVLYKFSHPHFFVFNTVMMYFSRFFLWVVTVLEFCITLQVRLQNWIKYNYRLPVATSRSHVLQCTDICTIKAIHAYQKFMTNLIFGMENYSSGLNFRVLNTYLSNQELTST